MNMRKRNPDGKFNSMPTASVEERFFSQVEMVPIAGCWIWSGASKNQFGYGAFKVGARSSKVELAHRYSWKLKFGEIPEGKCVCHTCDNPACVNPDHLFLGSHKDNALDKVGKSRHIFGSKTWNAKITEPVAKQIKELAHIPAKHLAEKFGLSRQSVNDIVFGRTWKHV